MSEVLAIVAGSAEMSLSSHKDLTRYFYARWPLEDSGPRTELKGLGSEGSVLLGTETSTVRV